MSNSKTFRTFALAVACALSMTAHAVADTPKTVNVVAGNLADALETLAKQCGVDVIYPSSQLKGLTTEGVSGVLETRAAFQELLRGTRLVMKEEGGSVLITLPTVEPVKITARVPEASVMRLAQADQTDSSQSSTEGQKTDNPENKNSESPSGDSESKLQEIVVTGTHIKGHAPVGSSLITIGREEIAKSGLATVQDVLRVLPQNFRGGASEETTEGRDASGNRGYEATGVNLRGLGNTATLVLIDGRRIAAGGVEGTITDVSVIPLSAIERIEVLPDGASSAYGADAIGGVVNFILRRNFAGAETQVRAGSVTDGGAREYQVSQALGGSWGEGSSGMLNYEFYRRDALPTSARRQTANSDLTPFGGTNWSTLNSNPGTIFTMDPNTFQITQTWAVPRGQDGTDLDPASFVPGSVNLQNELAGRDALPKNERHSIFGTLRHELNPRATLFADILYSRRDTLWDSGAAGLTVFPFITVTTDNPHYVNPTGGTEPVNIFYNLLDDFGSNENDFVAKSYSAAAGARLGAGRDWAVQMQAAYSLLETDLSFVAPDFAALAAALADTDPLTAFNPFGDGAVNNPATIERIRSFGLATTDSDLLAFNVVADGPLHSLPAGDLRLAVGAEHRRVSFSSTLVIPASFIDSPTDDDRRVNAAFAELLVPLVGSANARRGVQRLELSLAGRYEDYSDFGNATTPKVGLNWFPAAGFLLRGTWSKSFKAPNLTDLQEANNFILPIDTPDPDSPTQTVPVLAWAGKSADLQEERATVWTLGADLTPASAPGVRLALTYFDIAFEDRIEDPQFGAFLIEPALADLVTLNPTPEQRQALCSRAVFIGNPDDCLNAPIAAIVDFRIRNTAVNDISGFDFSASYTRAASFGQIDLGLSATYLERFEKRSSPLAVVQDLLNTATNPVDLRSRGSVSWTRGRWGAAAFLNYVDGYHDPRNNRPVDSWTTADLQLSYAIEAGAGGWLDDLDVALSLQNAFDEEPPFYDNISTRQGYDGENASILGRFVSLQLRKGW